MDQIVLKSHDSSRGALEAIFLPNQGMNLFSLKKGEVEVIDPSTKVLFEERFAGLGALIGPHFHHRNPATIPKIKDESLFPHIARVKSKGIVEPFSHGIARYAPWKATAKENCVSAVLTGKDLWNGITLAELEGQNFVMNFQAELFPDALELKLSVVSDTDSLVGIHYYYHLPKKRGVIYSQVQKKDSWPQALKIDAQQTLTYVLEESVDSTFHPFPNPLQGEIVLDAIDYRLITRYTSPSQENSWQLYHPAGASFVCIEPMSAYDPRHPNLTVSSMEIRLQIEI